jgi:hypothetical protein
MKNNTLIHFLEVGYAKGCLDLTAKEYKESYLKDVNAAFAECLTINKKQCPYYPYSKYHYSDIRSTKTQEKKKEILGFVDYLRKIVETISEDSNYLSKLKFISSFEKAASELIARPDLLFDIYVDKNQGAQVLDVLSKRSGLTTMLHDLFKTGTKTHKVRWQLLNIDLELAKLIRDFIKVKYDVSMKEFKEIIRGNEWEIGKRAIAKAEINSQFTTAVSNLNSVFINLHALFMGLSNSSIISHNGMG